MGKKKLLGWALAAGTAAAAAAWLLPEQPAPDAKAPPVAGPGKGEARPQTAPLGLPSRDGLSRPRVDIFAGHAPPAPPRAAKPAAEALVESAPPAPTAPPVPYRVAGQVLHDGAAQVILAREDRVYSVREGDILDGGYRVESIRNDGVVLVYTPLDIRQHLAAASSLRVDAPAAAAADVKPVQTAEGRPAQLRWEGPARVQAGSEFEVALKITSGQAVRGSPLQLSYDAKLLEPVSVRAGDFFVDGSFTYRVNPNGSIFVGAFGKGEVPDDAEFLVVTFKPIRAGATAELKLSSMVLQGPGGSAVGHEPLAAFRTSITQ